MRYVDRWGIGAPNPILNHGVWDSATEEWVTRNLSSQVASWHAALLTLRYDENGDRPDGRAWYRDPR
jgi:hypothetical protein